MRKNILFSKFMINIFISAVLMLNTNCNLIDYLLNIQLNEKSYKIGFVSDRNGKDEIFIMDQSGLNQKQITFNLAHGSHPTWFNDGQRILYISSEESLCYFSIVDINSDNHYKIRQNIGQDYPAYYHHPSLSPDDKYLAFVSFFNDNPDISLINLTSKQLIQLTDNIETDKDPSWSPNGNLIAYIANKGLCDHVMIMTIDGKNKLELTPKLYTGNNIRFPIWSLDCSKILFMNYQGRSIYSHLCIVDITGNNITYLNSTPLKIVDFPEWSLDNKKIYYGLAIYSDESYITEIYEFNLTNRKKNLLYTLPFLANIKFSSDRKYILITTLINGRSEIFLLNIDDQNLKQLTTEGGKDAYFSPKGVYYNQ